MDWRNACGSEALRVASSNAATIRIISGPGTGKTTALKARVARLLQDGINPTKILAVTFTRNAAANLVAELCDLGVPGCKKIRACTLHSFCFWLLSKNEVFEFLDRVPRPIVTFSSAGVLQFEGAPLIQDIDNKDVFGNKRDRTSRIRAFEAAWARLQSETPGWPTTTVDREFQKALAGWLAFHDAMMIGELVPEALRYLRTNPSALTELSFEHIIVDEFQDLNKAEQVLIDLLSSDGAILVAGDPDQSIYGFRHAHPEGIDVFGQTHPGTHDESLVLCHRCCTRIVEMANNLIVNNHDATVTSRLQAVPGRSSGEVYVVQWNRLDEEVDGLTSFVQHLVEDRGLALGDILILSPRRLMGYMIRDSLIEMGFQTHSFYHEEILKDDEAQLAFGLLALLANIEDRVALRFWLGYGSPTWLEQQYQNLREYCELNQLSPSRALELIVNNKITVPGISRLVKRFEALRARLGTLQPAKGDTLVDLLFPLAERWAEGLNKAAKLFVTEETGPDDLVEHFRTLVTQPEMPQSGDFAKVMSLHKSKGLTSRAVIVMGCIEGLIPHVDDTQSTNEREISLREQRRLFYVAMTRAKELLVLSSIASLPKDVGYKIGAKLGRSRSAQAPTISSRFLAELGAAAPLVQSGSVWQARGFV